MVLFVFEIQPNKMGKKRSTRSPIDRFWENDRYSVEKKANNDIFLSKSVKCGSLLDPRTKLRVPPLLQKNSDEK